MICPLLINAEPRQCMENHCAWWIEDKQKCAIKEIAERKVSNDRRKS